MKLITQPVIICDDNCKEFYFNNGYIPNRIKLLGAKKLIDEFLKMSDNEIKEYNDVVDEEWRIEMEKVNEECSKEYKINKPSKGYIYIYKQKDLYKIGKSKKFDCRFKKYVTENPEPIELVFKASSNDYSLAEESLHIKFTSSNYNREWFRLNDNDLDLLRNIKESEFSELLIDIFTNNI